MNDFITLKTFEFPHEAAMAQSLILVEGIPCFLKDENMATTNKFYSTAGGGVKLQVKETDAREAFEILSQGGYVTPEDSKPTLAERLNVFLKKLIT